MKEPRPLAPLPPINNEEVHGRRRRKRWIWGSCLIIFIAIVIWINSIVSGFFGNLTNLSTGGTEVTEIVVRGTGTDKIVIIDLHGIIGVAGDAVGSVSVEFMENMIQTAKEDSSVKAVILDIDSPGGGVVASVKIYEMLKKLDAEKPVIALYSGDAAASGGVYISAAARKIVSHPATLTGSIGVIAEFPEFSGLMQQYGVNWNVIKTGKFKDIGSFARPMTDEERSLLQQLLDEDYQDFVQAVSEGRKLSKEKVLAIADGRIFSGRTAKELGLVDELGDLTTAEEIAKKETNLGAEYQLVRYEPTFDLGSIFSQFVSKFNRVDALAIIDELEQRPAFKLSYLMK